MQVEYIVYAGRTKQVHDCMQVQGSRMMIIPFIPYSRYSSILLLIYFYCCFFVVIIEDFYCFVIAYKYDNVVIIEGS